MAPHASNDSYARLRETIFYLGSYSLMSSGVDVAGRKVKKTGNCERGFLELLFEFPPTARLTASSFHKGAEPMTISAPLPSTESVTPHSARIDGITMGRFPTLNSVPISTCVGSSRHRLEDLI